MAGWSYGKTALMFSGGAGLGKYHYGIIKALSELDLMSRIICGSTAGSIVATLICTHKFEELHRLTDYEIILVRPLWAGIVIHTLKCLWWCFKIKV